MEGWGYESIAAEMAKFGTMLDGFLKRPQKGPSAQARTNN
jgi:hypothetical protein